MYYFSEYKGQCKKEVTHLEREVGDVGSDHFRLRSPAVVVFFV